MAFYYPMHLPEVPAPWDDALWMNTVSELNDENLLSGLEAKLKAQLNEVVSNGGGGGSGVALTSVIGGTSQHDTDDDEEEQMDDDEEYESADADDDELEELDGGGGIGPTIDTDLV